MSGINSDSLVTVSKSRSEIVYTINDRELFYKNGLKAVQHNSKKGFVNCIKSNVNNTVKLKYDVSQYTQLTQIMSGISSTDYLRVVRSLLNIAVFLREDGTLQRENISINPADIYLDEDFKAYLIYVPVNVKSAPNAHMTFEVKLRNTLVALVNQYKTNKKLTNEFVIEICKCLTDSGISIQEIINRIDTQEIETKEASKKGNSQTKKPFRDDIPGFIKDNPEKKENPNQEILKPKSGADVISDLTKSKTYDKSNQKAEKNEVKAVKKKDGKAGKIIGLFAGYFVVVVIALLIIFNYYKNSGMTGGFIMMLVIFILAVLLIPVLILMKKTPPEQRKMSDDKLIIEDRKIIGGFVEPIVLKNPGEAVFYEFFINKEKYVIGKAKELVDGFISFDKTISDTHCEIIWNNTQFYIKDLESEYGTYVNGVRVIPGQASPLNNGDRIQLSKHIFTVTKV
ncbi:MAG: FHA domain-containing protein [Clostridia bacterium]|nr:FHA domain-containing protein [Clostridia bacterium]